MPGSSMPERGSVLMIDREHTWGWCLFYSGSIALCICIDILQHAAPLPFLPQHLEERGHNSMEIAAVMGSYYWSGFAGGCILTAYQIHGVLFGKFTPIRWSALRSHILKLMVGLFLGGATLLVEANAGDMDPLRMHTVHLLCRLTQGFLGSFLFFYAYLLAATAFEGQQMQFALTLTTISLNVAEVFGPFVGAAIFTAWGQSTCYYVLAGLSFVNNALLIVVYYTFPKDIDEEDSETTSLVSDTERGRANARRRSRPDEENKSDRHRSQSPRSIRVWNEAPMAQERCTRLQRVLTDSWLIRSLVVIFPAATIKSSIESILPLFGDNHGYNEYEVGMLFTLVALGFIFASITLYKMWDSMSQFVRNIVLAVSLLLLGLLACGMLYTYGESQSVWAADFIKELNGSHHYAFYSTLFVYGILLGLTHTGASYLLGEVIEELDDEKSKGAANGVWNTGWELGGSIGFVTAGFASTDSWKQEQEILQYLGIVCLCACCVFCFMTFQPMHGGLHREIKSTD